MKGDKLYGGENLENRIIPSDDDFNVQLCPWITITEYRSKSQNEGQECMKPESLKDHPHDVVKWVTVQHIPVIHIVCTLVS